MQSYKSRLATALVVLLALIAVILPTFSWAQGNMSDTARIVLGVVLLIAFFAGLVALFGWVAKGNRN